MDIGKYINWCNDIICRYIQRMTKDKGVFEAKLSKLVIKYSKANNDFHTNGCFFPQINSNRGKIGIIYIINPEDPKPFIEFVMAHELGHLIFWDENISFSDEYGIVIEECLVDYIASIIIQDVEPEISKEYLVSVANQVDYDSRIAKGGLEVAEKIIEKLNLKAIFYSKNDVFEGNITNSIKEVKAQINWAELNSMLENFFFKKHNIN